MAVIDTLPPSLARTLMEYPRVGERNVWLFTVAAQARHIASPRRVRAFLEQVARQQGWSDRDFSREIDRAISRAYSIPSLDPQAGQPGPITETPSPPRPASRPAPWPSIDPQLAAVVACHEILFDLEPLAIDPAVILDALFAPTDLLCLALDHRSAITQPREAWRGIEAALQFIVANPMTAPSGLTQEGRPSERCHGNATRSRRYQVVEFDQGTPEEQAAILSSLHSQRTPLVLVVWSGGKSLHGWFDVRHLDEAEKREFFATACLLGADSSLWDPAKLVRMPGGRRSTGVRQLVYDFQPQLIQRPHA